MKVFISWSGEPSRTIACELSGWLRGIIQSVEPWMSDEAIGSGKRWRDEIGAALNGIDFAIVCLTLANQHSPWLVFEAGALSKHLELARVIPLCIDIDPADITGPLAEWQARRLDRDGIRRLVWDINAATPKPLPEQLLTKFFEIMWPDLDAAVSEAQVKAFREQQAQYPEREVSDQILERIEQLERSNRRRRLVARVSPVLASSDLVESVPELYRRFTEFRTARNSQQQSPEHS